jgi:3-keto-disaccharide hydrolase
MRIALAAIGIFVMAGSRPAFSQERPLNQASPGFIALFNGKDLSGWRGRQGTYSPHAEALLTKDELAAKQVQWNSERDLHWRVDTAKGEIVSDGKSVHLATAKDYGDFELYVDWLMVNHNGDSGIYLRSYPQVQIWDVDNPREVRNGAPRGSGALWNNNADNPGKWPLVKADNPVGEWNTFRIKMIGSRVWVWFNGKVTVDAQVLDNFYDRSLPLVPKGAIELQTHGSEIRFRNIYLREISPAEAKASLDKLGH